MGVLGRFRGACQLHVGRGADRPTEDDPAECEALLYLADEVYEELTDKDAAGAEGDDSNPKGKRWKETELPTRLPKLWKVMQR